MKTFFPRLCLAVGDLKTKQNTKDS